MGPNYVVKFGFLEEFAHSRVPQLNTVGDVFAQIEQVHVNGVIVDGASRRLVAVGVVVVGGECLVDVDVFNGSCG